MKVGINARTFTVDEPGGAVQSAKRLTTEMITHSDHEVTLFGSPELSDEFEIEVCSTGYIDNQAYGLFWERTILPIIVDKGGIDVLYCPNGNAPLNSMDTSVVMCIHDVNAQGGWSSGIHQLYRGLAIPKSAQRCDAIVTVSEFSKREIIETLNVPENKVNVIYNGVSDTYFNGDGKEIQLPERYLLFVGSLNPRKNISGLVKAFQQVRSDYPEIELVIIGPDNKSIFKNFDEDLDNSINICGFLEENEVKYAYENAEALVFPSYYEGFGLPPLESLAVGTPVVASNRTALPEILGDTAVFVNPDEPSDIAKGIREVLQRTNIDREPLRQHAQKYQWSVVADRLSATLEQVHE